jgi:hypothetical protein
MRLWFTSLLGPQQAVQAIWARLVKGERATLQTEALAAPRFCALAIQTAGRWRFLHVGLPAVGGCHGVLFPEVARFAGEDPAFVLLAREPAEAPDLHLRFLDRRLDLPLHPSWASWLWARGLQCGEVVPLTGRGLLGYRCAADRDALAEDLAAAIAAGALSVPSEPVGASAMEPACAAA